MRSRRFDRILTGTAIALVLGLASTGNIARAQDEKAIEALVPMPEPANVPPPSIADVGGAPETTGSTNSTAIVLPDPPRSEEHTSELQSPYVISYAVFC